MVESDTHYIYTDPRTFVCHCGWTVPADEQHDELEADSAIRLHLLITHGLPVGPRLVDELDPQER
jgi:hypothetical protein